MEPRVIQRFGWIPDLPDQRDMMYSIKPQAAGVLPPLVDLTPKLGPVMDQGQLGSCTANAIAGLIVHRQIAQTQQATAVSRLFIYYGEREMEGTIGQDSGAMIRDGMKVVNKSGAPKEALWPYDISKFTRKPSATAYKDALKRQVLKYQAVPQDPNYIRAAIAADDPIVFGFTVYESMMSGDVARTGSIPMPRAGERVLGGHAIYLCGYDDQAQLFMFRNSWGNGWGKNGNGFIPYGYVLHPQLASDFWTLDLIEG